MTACPVCHSLVTETMWRVSAEEAAQHFVGVAGDAGRHKDLVASIRRLWKQDECAIAHCNACGFSFAVPFVAGDKSFYNIAYPRPSRVSQKWDFDRTLSEMSSLNSRMDSVLEIGAGYGFFLDKITDTYVPRSGVHAIDYRDVNVNQLIRKGYTAFDRDVRTLDLHQTFDAIFMFQVVEHMDDLDTLFAKVSSLLSRSGLLFITVPNAIRTGFQEAHASLRDMPPNHIGGWSPKAFRIIAARHGLRMVKHETEPFSLKTFAKKDLYFFYLRRAQEAGTIENWARLRRSRSLGKWLSFAVAACNAPRRIRVWSEAARRTDLGMALWVMFRRDEDGALA